MSAGGSLTRALAVLALGGSLLAAQSAPAAYPEAEISNGQVRARLYLPDVERGYYRATRFDWSGVIASAEWNGHTYFGKWYAREHDPRGHDAITGPVEEYDPVGYEEARPGDLFVRIGVGAIRRPAEPAYRRFSTYDIADHGTWTINRGPDRIEFVHELGDSNGYAYVYRKIVRLDEAALVLEHRLRNTGRKTIATSVYNHDFFMLDNQPTGPDFVVRFPFEPAAVSSLDGMAEIRGREFVYLQELQRAVQSQLTGFGPTAADYDFRVENRRTGAGVRQIGDRPMTKINLWSPRTTVCPEAFIDVRVEPGGEDAWAIRYEFYEAGR
jgi:hypothetical protein